MPTSAPQVNEKQAIDLVMKLLPIPGRSGEESLIMKFIVESLTRAGCPKSAIKFDNAHRKSIHGGEVGNLIVKLPARGKGMSRLPRRLLVAHVDTVPICVGGKAKRKGHTLVSSDKTHAIGADNRSGVGAVLSAALTLLREKLPHPPVTFLFPVQEEVGLQGARYVPLNLLGNPKLAFNYDGGPPTRLNIAATGAYRMTIDITGYASHAGVHPKRGVSALTIASLAIAQLHKDGYLGYIKKGSRTGTSNIGSIAGGQALNVVAPAARVTAEVRSHDPRFRKTIVAQFRKAFEQAARSVRNDTGLTGSVIITDRLDYESFQLKHTEPCVTVAQQAVYRVVGSDADLRTVDGGLDANWLTNRGIPCVTLGAGQSGAHTIHEALDLKQYVQGCNVALRLAMAMETA